MKNSYFLASIAVISLLISQSVLAEEKINLTPAAPAVVCGQGNSYTSAYDTLNTLLASYRNTTTTISAPTISEHHMQYQVNNETKTMEGTYWIACVSVNKN